VFDLARIERRVDQYRTNGSRSCFQEADDDRIRRIRYVHHIQAAANARPMLTLGKCWVLGDVRIMRVGGPDRGRCVTDGPDQPRTVGIRNVDDLRCLTRYRDVEMMISEDYMRQRGSQLGIRHLHLRSLSRHGGVAHIDEVEVSIGAYNIGTIGRARDCYRAESLSSSASTCRGGWILHIQNG
jgi:hypothetical protein